MLRGFVFLVGIAVLIGGAIALEAGAIAPGVFAVVIGLVLTAGVIYERVQYKPILDRLPPGDWRPTEERFIDPETNRTVTVYANAKGRRIYVGGETIRDGD